jgi:hypothetical protein
MLLSRPTKISSSQASTTYLWMHGNHLEQYQDRNAASHATRLSSQQQKKTSQRNVLPGTEQRRPRTHTSSV